MKILKFSFLALASAFTMAASVPCASAETISAFTSTIATSGASAQVGRLSRNSIQQDWLGTETYPGVINTTTTYDYTTYTYSSTMLTGAQYVDISIYDELNAANFFVSAYANSYNPANLALNWLGDEGASGNYFGTDPRYFDVIVPVGDSLVLVVNNTAAALAGINSPFDIVVSAYADTSYDDPAPVPEPSTLVLLGTGVVGLAAAARRRLGLAGV